MEITRVALNSAETKEPAVSDEFAFCRWDSF
jgi:hypothetical protein